MQIKINSGNLLRLFNIVCTFGIIIVCLRDKTTAVPLIALS